MTIQEIQATVKRVASQKNRGYDNSQIKFSELLEMTGVQVEMLCIALNGLQDVSLSRRINWNA